MAHGRQLDQPHPVRELIGELGGHLHGKAGLADPADAGQRDQSVRPGPAPPAP